MSIVGKRIHDRRIELGLSADSVAEKLGKNRATIYRYEGDDIENMPLQIITPLAEILCVSPAYLMGWTDEMNLETSRPVQKDEPERDEFIRLFSSLNSENRQRMLDLMKVLVEGQAQADARQQ